uniref:Putative chemosensory protein n=1 Tax=Triatoma brasiliensis TaxID=65344 RepID=A0A162RQ85_TRIBS|nr:putative chemosensory protein [Triatoma brasiliensis]
MQGLTVVLICSLATALSATTYTTKYDNIDLDAVLRNDRVYKTYYNCLTNKGKCSPEGKELKDKLPDALQTGCSKCSARQKQGLEKIIKFLMNSKQADFKEFERIYDPTGEYRKRYAEQAKKKGIKV